MYSTRSDYLPWLRGKVGNHVACRQRVYADATYQARDRSETETGQRKLSKLALLTSDHL